MVFGRDGKARERSRRGRKISRVVDEAEGTRPYPLGDLAAWGRRAGQAGMARGVRPRSVEQKRRGKTIREGEVLGRCTESAG